MTFTALTNVIDILNEGGPRGVQKVENTLSMSFDEMWDNYNLPFQKELNSNILPLSTKEAKEHLIRHYIYELNSAVEALEQHRELLTNGFINENTPHPQGQKYSHLTLSQNFGAFSRSLLKIIIHNIEVACFKFNINFFEVCDDLYFNLEFLRPCQTDFIEIRKKHFIDKKRNILDSSASYTSNPKIIFSSENILDDIFDLLKGAFKNEESTLYNIMCGKPSLKKLVFNSNQNKLVEFFSRIKYHGYILSTPKELNNWICANFLYESSKGDLTKISNFNPQTISEILNKGKGEPPINERIYVVEWLKYIPISIRKE